MLTPSIGQLRLAAGRRGAPFKSRGLLPGPVFMAYCVCPIHNGGRRKVREGRWNFGLPLPIGLNVVPLSGHVNFAVISVWPPYRKRALPFFDDNGGTRAASSWTSSFLIPGLKRSQIPTRRGHSFTKF